MSTSQKQCREVLSHLDLAACLGAAQWMAVTQQQRKAPGVQHGQAPGWPRRAFW